MGERWSKTKVKKAKQCVRKKRRWEDDGESEKKEREESKQEKYGQEDNGKE